MPLIHRVDASCIRVAGRHQNGTFWSICTARPSSGTLFRGSVARPKLLQEVSRRNEVARLETLRKSVDDRVEKFERFVSLRSISPESCEADATTQFIGEQSPLPRKLKRLQQACLALTCVLLRHRCEDLALYA